MLSLLCACIIEIMKGSKQLFLRLGIKMSVLIVSSSASVLTSSDRIGGFLPCVPTETKTSYQKRY